MIIVGGGIAGCTTALSLARSNPAVSFLLIDDAEPVSFKVSLISFWISFHVLTGAPNRELDWWITSSWSKALATVFMPNVTRRAWWRHYQRNAYPLYWQRFCLGILQVTWDIFYHESFWVRLAPWSCYLWRMPSKSGSNNMPGKSSSEREIYWR